MEATSDEENTCRNCKWFIVDNWGKTGWGECDSDDAHDRIGGAGGIDDHFVGVEFEQTFGCRFFEVKEKN